MVNEQQKSVGITVELRPKHVQYSDTHQIYNFKSKVGKFVLDTIFDFQ